MKYEREFKFDTLPCGDEVVAKRREYSNCWRLWSVEEGDDVDESIDSTEPVYIKVSSIPGIIELLQRLYNHTPLKYRK